MKAGSSVWTLSRSSSLTREWTSLRVASEKLSWIGWNACRPRWAPSLPAVKTPWCSNGASASLLPRSHAVFRRRSVCDLVPRGRSLIGKRAATGSKSRGGVTASPDVDYESLLLRERVFAVESDEACPGYSAAPHEPLGTLLEEDYLLSATWAYRLHQSPSHSELLLKRSRDGRESRGDQRGVVRSVLG